MWTTRLQARTSPPTAGQPHVRRWKIQHLAYSAPALVALLAFVVVLVTLARTALAAPVAYADPFVPYDAIVPGQSAMVLAQYSCSFVYTGHYTADETGYCQIHPEDGPIVMVTVTVRDGAVQRLSFIVQDILFGDLVQRWGRPDTLHKGGRFYVARWSEGVYATAQTYQWFTYQSNVHHVSLGFARERAM